MNISLRHDSPLGQYLAELDHGATTSATASSLAGDEVARPRDRNPQPAVPQTQCRLSLWNHAQQFASEELLTKLADDIEHFHPDLRESVLEAAAISKGSKHIRVHIVRWWIPHWLQRLDAQVVVLMASICIGVSTISSSGYNQTPPLLFVAIAVVGCFELLYQFLLLRYSYAVRRYLNCRNLYFTSVLRLQMSVRSAIDIVKRSELATRGYRLGSVLPPVGRLEEASNGRNLRAELQCRRIRSNLREVNECVERAAYCLVTRSPMVAVDKFRCEETTSNSDSNSPSLLVTALKKKHDLSFCLLDSALQDILVEDLALLFTRSAGFLSTLDDQTKTFHELTHLMQKWAIDLAAWSEPLPLTNENVNKKNKSSPAGYGAVPGVYADLSRTLLDLQASCDTLKALALASHHSLLDIVGKNGITDAMMKKQVQDCLGARRQQISKLIHGLTSECAQLEKALDELDQEERTDKFNDREATEGSRCASHNAESDDRATERVHSHNAERDYLLIFTGTSTGEKDFDLQALLRQQRLDEQRRVATPVPSFMVELQDVLDRRQALSTAPILEKRIGVEISVGKVQPQARMVPPLEILPSMSDLQQVLGSQFGIGQEEEYIGDPSDESEDGSQQGED